MNASNINALTVLKSPFTKPYLVFYMINEKEKMVEIHRILHGSMDINQHLLE